MFGWKKNDNQILLETFYREIDSKNRMNKFKTIFKTIFQKENPQVKVPFLKVFSKFHLYTEFDYII